MIGYSILNNVFNELLTSKLVSKVYHDVILKTEKDNRYPVYPHGDEFYYVGVDDTAKMSCYFRQTGELRNVKTGFAQSCQVEYLCRVPFRMVLFNDFEKRNFDSLNAAFLNVMFNPFVEFVALISDSERILKEESLVKNFTFGAQTYYVAIDFILIIQLNKDNCETVIDCEKIPNPICRVNIPVIGCGDPVLLSVTEITTTSALLTWFSVSGAISYDVYYKAHNSPVWIFAATLYSALNYTLNDLEEDTQYDYKIKSNCGGFSQGTFTTNPASGLVNFQYGWSGLPFGDGTGGTVDKTTFPYQFTGTFTPGGNLVTQFTGMPINVFIGVRYPNTESNKVIWMNTESNYGQIPDSVMNEISLSGANKYITSRIEMTLDNLFTTVFE